MDSEVKKLLQASVIKELQYLTYLYNSVMVPNANKDWRICQVFTNLNKFCPKNCYQLPFLNRLVDATVRHEILCFLDTFSDYYQIYMHSSNAEKTTFMILISMYYYVRMSFRLKSAGNICSIF